MGAPISNITNRTRRIQPRPTTPLSANKSTGPRLPLNQDQRPLTQRNHYHLIQMN